MVNFSIEMQASTSTRVEVGRGDGTTYWTNYPHTRAYLGERSLHIVCMATGAFVASTPRSWIVSFMRCPAPASQTEGCPHSFCRLDPSPMILPHARHMAGRVSRGQASVTVTPGKREKSSTRRGWIRKFGERTRRLIGNGTARA